MNMVAKFTSFLLLFFILTFFSGHLAHGSVSQESGQDIIITLPAKTVLKTLQDILPLELATEKQGIDGQLVIESISQLTIENDTLSVKGVIQGSNLSIMTKIANQNIRLKVGEVLFSISSDLQTAFDEKKKILFITPSFPNQTDGALQPLLTALELETFQLHLDARQLLDIKAGGRTFTLGMTIIDIAGMNNNLIFRMHPKVGPPQ